MSYGNRGSFSSLGFLIVATGWPIAVVLGLILHTEILFSVGDHKKFDAEEIQCRGREQARIADQQVISVAKGKKTKEPSEEEAADPEKGAREYCVARRGAIASERQAESAGLALAVGYIALVAAVSAALAAGFAAFRARETIETMRDTSKRELRAYLSFAVESAGDFNPGQTVHLDCRIKNHGSTPAFKINCEYDMGIFPYPLPAGHQFGSPAMTSTRRASLFPAADTEYRLDQTQPFPAAQYALAPTGRLHVWGTMVYEDIFHVTRRTKIHVSLGGPDLIAAMAAIAANPRAQTRLMIRHEDGHNQIEDETAS